MPALTLVLTQLLLRLTPVRLVVIRYMAMMPALTLVLTFKPCRFVLETDLRLFMFFSWL